MWWQYIILGIFFVVSVLFIAFRFKKRVEEPGCGSNCSCCSIGSCGIDPSGEEQ